MILNEIISAKIKEILYLKEIGYYDKLMDNLFSYEVRDFKSGFLNSNLGIIAEIKKASPSKGIIVEDFNLEKIIHIYKDLNIDAISVLTEKNFFKGNIEYIKKVKEGTNKAILRKDFIVDEVQIFESRAVGADAVLLIAAALKEKLGRFYSISRELGLQCLVEVHDEEELRDALSIGAEIIGINNRNLYTFEVDLETTERLIKMIPKDKVVISESGVKTDKDIERLKNAKVNGLLIGESLMRMLDNKKDMEDFVSKIKL